MPESDEVLGDWAAPPETPPRAPPISMWIRRSCRSLSGMAARARSSWARKQRIHIPTMIWLFSRQRSERLAIPISHHAKVGTGPL